MLSFPSIFFSPTYVFFSPCACLCSAILIVTDIFIEECCFTALVYYQKSHGSLLYMLVGVQLFTLSISPSNDHTRYSKSAVSLDLDAAGKLILLRVFDVVVCSRHPLIRSRTTFYQLPWSISPVPTHLDRTCSDSSHLPSLSARLPASGLPTLPVIILLQLSATSFSFIRSHITRYSAT